jgi:hypothetical protein
LVVVLDWHTKKVVGHYAGLQARAWHWLVALNRAVNHQFPQGIEGQRLNLMADNGCQPTSLAFMRACAALGIRQAFTSYSNPKGNAGTPPLALLDDPTMSDPLRLVIRRPRASFESRYDLGVALVDLLDGLDVAEVRQMPVSGTGYLSVSSNSFVHRMKPAGGNLAQIDRYLLQLENHRTRYRHLVRTTWSVVRVHDSAARFMLAGPLHVHGEAAEQLGAYQDVITCKPLIAAIGSLVWDVDRGRLKRGFGGSGPGSARRVQVVAKQFGLTYDLHSMRPERILHLLPREFDRFRDGPPPPNRRPRLAVRAHRREGGPKPIRLQ